MKITGVPEKQISQFYEEILAKEIIDKNILELRARDTDIQEAHRVSVKKKKNKVN